MKSTIITLGTFLTAWLLLINYSQSPPIQGKEVLAQELQGTTKETLRVVAMAPAEKAVVLKKKLETSGKGFIGRHLRILPTPTPIAPATPSSEQTFVQPIIEWQW